MVPDIQYVNCNICGADKTIPIVAQNGYNVVACCDCGLVYVNPRPAPEALIKLYDDYHGRDGGDEHTWALLMENIFEEISAVLNKMFPQRGNILDIGCGYGHFVEMMKGHGWSATGIEPSEHAFVYAQTKGLDVRQMIIENAAFPDNSFDVITVFYVLEHLFDPLLALNNIKSMLKPGGAIVLRVPHTTPIVKLLKFFRIQNNLYDVPFHLYDFSPVTIRRLLKKAGFAGIRVVPGCSTVPQNWAERIVAVGSGIVARQFFSLSGEKLLLPGVSKTVIAIKLAEGRSQDHG